MNLTLRHALKLSALTLGIALLFWALRNFSSWPHLIHESYPLMLLFFFILTFTTSSLVLLGARRHREQFNAFFFSAMIFRFFAAFIFILVSVLLGMENVLFFVLDFFVLYLLYQLFEITTLMANLRSHLEN